MRPSTKNHPRASTPAFPFPTAAIVAERLRAARPNPKTKIEEAYTEGQMRAGHTFRELAQYLLHTKPEAWTLLLFLQTRGISLGRTRDPDVLEGRHEPYALSLRSRNGGS